MNSLGTARPSLSQIGLAAGSIGAAGIAYYFNKCHNFYEIINETGKVLTSQTKLNAEKSFEQLNCAWTYEKSIACLVFGMACLTRVLYINVLIARRRHREELIELVDNIRNENTRLEAQRERFLNADGNIDLAAEGEEIDAIGRSHAANMNRIRRLLFYTALTERLR